MLNGLLILDKPTGMTSHDVVSIVRRATSEKSIGHLGTLDPLATGVLPLLLGKYTRLAQFFAQNEKQYTGTITFGQATDSFDSDGNPTGDLQPLERTFEQLQQLATKFHGELDQVPPIFSAKKINGVPAYKLARAGLPTPVKPARIHIHDFRLLALHDQDATFTMTVSAGGYVRSVAHELGQLAGCGAHLSSLRRTRAGLFTLAQAITIDQLKESTPAQLAELLPHPRTLLPDLPSVTVDELSAGPPAQRHAGQPARLLERPARQGLHHPTDLLAIARRVAGTLMHPQVVIG